ncbi:MAG: SEC-C domain-containing protein [Candidatus Latescibacteria bacterium]|nr:SEC-C domain-containing protein [Candidatus Latescibacterota bacterium]
MVELLQDGEEVEWIVSQVLAQGPAEAVEELSALLAQIAAQVAPVAEPVAELASALPAEAPPAMVLPEEEDAGLPDLENLALPPGVDARQFKELMSSPQGAMLADFGTFCQEQGVDQGGDPKKMSGVLQELHEVWLQTPRPALEGKKPAEVLDGGRLFPTRVETFKREAPKVGRNDPCPCGSGKKFKKCCGKE